MSINAAGDMRLQCLRDKVAPRGTGAPSAPALVCSSKVQVSTDTVSGAYPSGFGAISKRNAFGKAARRFIRESGAALEQADRRKLIFLTGTLPGSTIESFKALAAWSGWVVQTLMNWVRDNDEGAEYFGVWEYQQRGALHMHMCVKCSTIEKTRWFKENFKRRWIAVLDAVGVRANQDMFARKDGESWSTFKWVTRTDAQSVEKSVCNYLGKYLSKGSRLGRKSCCYPPSSWFFCCRTLRQRVSTLRRMLTVSFISPSNCFDLFERLGAIVAEHCPKSFYYLNPFDCQQKGLVSLMQPIQASMVYNDLKSILRLLGLDQGHQAPDAVPSLNQVASLFNGQVLSIAL
jgi:hypothetical protein